MFLSSRTSRGSLRRFGAMVASGALVASFAGLSLANPAGAATTTVGPIDFEDYEVTNINGQNGWSKTGAYDVEVENVSTYPDAAGYGFQTKALRASNGYADGAFGGQAFSPGVSQPAGEGAAASYFSGSFDIGTTKAAKQAGLAISVSPDDGNGGRMSYLRFEDQDDGVRVFFVDVTNETLGTTSTFNPDVLVATLDRDSAHNIRFEITFVDGAGTDGVGNDVVKIFVDGALEHTGTTWENYYRYDTEQAGNNNVVPTTSKLLFAARGAPNAPVLGQGYLIDDVGLSSSTTAPVVTPPNAPGEEYAGNMKCADFDPTWQEFKIDGIPVNKAYDDPKSDLVITISNASPQTFDWASNSLDMSAVLVKGGNGGTKYMYPGAEDFSDTGLHALKAKKDYRDISHVSFCFKVGGDQPTVDEPGTPPTETPQPETPRPGNPRPGNPQSGNPQPGNPQAVNPQTAVQPTTEVLGETLVQDATLPRTGATAIPLVLAGGLGLGSGLLMLMLGRRKTAVVTR